MWVQLYREARRPMFGLRLPLIIRIYWDRKIRPDINTLALFSGSIQHLKGVITRTIAVKLPTNFVKTLDRLYIASITLNELNMLNPYHS